MEKNNVAYTQKDKLLLAALVEQNSLVENKKTDAATIQMKQQAWLTITKQYNAQGDIVSVTRSDTQLKKLWNNLKQRKRKENIQFRYSQLKTGGGPAPKEDDDPVMQAVAVAAPHVDVVVECPWDSTANFNLSTGSSSSQDPLAMTTAEEPEMFTTSVSRSHITPCGANGASGSSAAPPPSDDSLATNVNDDAAAVSRKQSKIEQLQHDKDTMSPAKPTPRKRGAALLENESNLRVKKLRETVEQQYELHQIRKKVEEELLRKVTSERRKAEAEELAKLKLTVFRNENFK